MHSLRTRKWRADSDSCYGPVTRELKEEDKNAACSQACTQPGEPKDLTSRPICLLAKRWHSPFPPGANFPSVPHAYACMRVCVRVCVCACVCVCVSVCVGKAWTTGFHGST
jgi:hypothetical protein